MTEQTLTGVVVGLKTFHESNQPYWTIEDSLEELSDLAKTADITITHTVIQDRDRPHPRTYIGKGKLEELKALVVDECLALIITDDELTPIQHKHLEKELEIKVLDRTSLILDIFAQRAQTYEAQLQIEHAQLEYLLPRLTRMWTHLSRQSGGIGSRGPGETQLEVDKRQIRKKMTFIKDKLKKVASSRETQKKHRLEKPVITGAIVGYTNAGKSTLINALTNANVLSEDKLFATLDPTSRRLTLPNNEDIILIDTVGFIQKLPTNLVNAFRSTLEVAKDADFLLHVIDVSHENAEGMIEIAEKTLKQLDINVPQLYVFNKMDKVAKPNTTKTAFKAFTPNVFMSVYSGDFDGLYKAIEEMLEGFRKRFTFHIPYSRMDIVNLLHKYGHIEKEEYGETIAIEATLQKTIGEKIMGQLLKP